MAAVLLEAPQIISAIIALVNAGVQGYASLKKTTDMIAAKNAAGQPITQGDMWGAVGDDDTAKKALEAAIAAAS
jgi:hypothetical protein